MPGQTREYLENGAAEEYFGNHVTGKAQDKLGMLGLEKRIMEHDALKGLFCRRRLF